MAGLLYFNVLGTTAPLEIRGQVLPAEVEYKTVPPLASPSGAFVDR